MIIVKIHLHIQGTGVTGNFQIIENSNTTCPVGEHS